jgi:hypothetical protein
VPGRIPNHVQVDPVVSVSQPIAHPANVAPGLVWHQLGCTVAQTVRSFAHTFDATLHGVTQEAVPGESGAIYACQVLLDPLGVLDDVGCRPGRA